MKEKYWADVVVQMQNARAHVSGSGRGGGHKRKRMLQSGGGDNVKLEATEGEQQRGAGTSRDVRRRGPRDMSKISRGCLKTPERKNTK